MKETEVEEVPNGKEAETEIQKVMKPVLDCFGCVIRWE